MPRGTRVGDFTTVTGIDAGNGHVLELSYGANALTLVVVQP